jgi:hypothetical protein
MRIDCERCPGRRGSRRCDGCVVGFILELEDRAAVLEGDEVEDDGTVLADADEARAVRRLAEAGLLAPVRVLPLEEAG